MEREFECPVEVSVSVLGGKWKVLVLFHLLRAPRRTGELRRLIPGVSQKVLTQQLRQLEADGLVRRTVSEHVPPRVEYSVTPAEHERLAEVMAVLCSWGTRFADSHGHRIRHLGPTRSEAS